MTTHKKWILQVAAIVDVEEFLKAWDVQRTEELLKNLEENKKRKLEEEQAQQKQECDRFLFYYICCKWFYKMHFSFFNQLAWFDIHSRYKHFCSSVCI